MVILIYGKFGTGIQFFPDDKADGARINVTARGNLTTEEKTKYINEVVEIIDKNQYVENYVANTVQRKHIWIFDQNPSDIIAKVWMEFKNPDEILDPSIIIDELRRDFDKIVGYGIEIKENSISSVLNAGKPIEIEVSSSDKRLLAQTAEIIKSKLEISSPHASISLNVLDRCFSSITPISSETSTANGSTSEFDKTPADCTKIEYP